MDTNIPFQVIDWNNIPKESYIGETSSCYWQTLHLPGLRIRLVEYLPGYLADHGAKKDILCIAFKDRSLAKWKTPIRL